MAPVRCGPLMHIRNPLTGGLILFLVALKTLLDQFQIQPVATQPLAAPPDMRVAIMPLAFPTIVTPYGIAALVVLMAVSPDLEARLTIGGIVVAIMLSNLLFMLLARKIMPVPRMICASPDYLARHGTPRHPQDLREHASLTYGFLLTGNQWKLTGADGDHWIQPAWSLCVNNAEVLRDVAIKGRGLALLPEFIAADALRKGELRTVLDEYSAPPLALYAVYPPTRHLSVKVRLFIDFLVERFGREDEAGGRRSRG